MFSTYVVFTVVSTVSSMWCSSWTPPSGLRSYLYPSALMWAQSKPVAETRLGRRAERRKTGVEGIRMAVKAILLISLGKDSPGY